MRLLALIALTAGLTGLVDGAPAQSPMETADASVPTKTTAAPVSVVDATSTWLLRLSIGLGGALAFMLGRRRRGTVLQPVAQPALQDPDRNPA